MKRLLVIAVLLMSVAAGLLLYAYFAGAPPDESKLTANFFSHQAVYEQLRQMLIADQTLRRVTLSAVETSQFTTPQTPPNGLPVERYQEYLRLLKEISAEGAIRADGASPESICIAQWGSGFGGDSRHVEICWMRDNPSPQVNSLKDFYRSPKPRRPSFIKLKDQWYISPDW